MNIHAVGVHTARPAEGGCTRGVSAERFETPLVGRAACFWRRGGNPPAPAFPRRGKRERGRSNLLAAAGICLRITPEYRQLTPSPQALTATQKPEFPKLYGYVLAKRDTRWLPSITPPDTSVQRDAFRRHIEACNVRGILS